MGIVSNMQQTRKNGQKNSNIGYIRDVLMCNMHDSCVFRPRFRTFSFFSSDIRNVTVMMGAFVIYCIAPQCYRSVFTTLLLIL